MVKFEFFLLYGRAPLRLRRFLHWAIFMRFRPYPPPVTILDFIHSFKIFTREGGRGPASKSEIRRWIKAGNIWINCDQVDDPNEKVHFPVDSLILFPKGKRVTLW